ncbi:Ferroporti-1, partial [Hyaloraphidium curvatum]
LYISFFLTSWSARMEDFATVVLLLGIFRGTLFFAAVLGFATTGAAIIGGQTVGNLIDRTGRLFAIRSSISSQKACIIAINLLLYGLYRVQPSDAGAPVSPAAATLFALVVLFAALLKLSNMANAISLEKDWVVVASRGDPDRLAGLNASVRRIDLLSNVLAPLLVSLFVSVLPLPFTVLLLIVWNLLSYPLEYRLIGNVYRAVPGLAEPKPAKAPREPQPYWYLDPSHHARHVRNSFGRFAHDWSLYARHPVLLPSLSVAFLYFTSLSFGGITITYLESVGVGTAAVAAARGVGVVAGIGATVAEPPMIRGIGLPNSGLLGLWGEVALLIPAAALVFPINAAGGAAPASLVYPFLGLLAASRFFLWTADLSIEAQLMQEMVAPGVRGRINGVHGSVCAAAEMAQYVAVAVWSSPEAFGGLAAASAASVALGAATFAVWV